MYNVWLSLFGFAACVTIMFLIDWISSLITFAVVLALYMVVVYRKPDVNWVIIYLFWGTNRTDRLIFPFDTRDRQLKRRPTRPR